MSKRIDKATKEEFENAPKTVELFCRTGFENIKGQENENGKNDYVHIKLDKRFVTYKVVGCHKNEDGEVSMSCRKVKAKGDKRKEALKARIAEAERVASQANEALVNLEEEFDNLEDNE